MVKHSAHLVGNISKDENSSSFAFKQFLLSITLISFILCILLLSGLVYAENNGNIKDVGNSKGIIPTVALENRAGLSIDNIKQFSKTQDTPRGTVKIKNSFLYFPLGTIEELELQDNSDSCGQFCYAEKKVTTYVDTKLVDSIKFLKLQDDESWKEASIRNYSFYIKQNIDDEWIPYNYEVMPAGMYYIRLEGEKRPEWTYDWIITSQGIEITDWSIWGGLAGTLSCFQESANTSNQNGNDGSCGLNYSGGYNLSCVGVGGCSAALAYDGDYSTGTVFNLNGFFINYSIPVNANAATWFVNDSYGEYNFSIPSSCFGTSDLLRLKMVSMSAGITYSMVYYCWDGAWNNFINGNIGGLGVSIYEESIYWNLSRGNVTLNSPANASALSSSNVTFNCSATIVGGSTLVNMSAWTFSGGAWVRNSTVALTGSSNTTAQLSALFENGASSKWNCEACDSDGVCGFSSANRSFTVSFAQILNTTMTYNATSFETKHETFTLNMTWNNNTYPLLNATFVYNNTRYIPVRNGATTNNTFFRVEIDVPLFVGFNGTTGNNSFYWIVNMTDSLYNSYYVNSSFNNQTIKPIYLKFCNSTVNQTYLNVSFRDEVSLLQISQTLILSTNYSIGDGNLSTVQKAFYFDGGSATNGSYSFCFSEPSQFVRLNNFFTRYSSILGIPSYPERTYSLSSYELTNVTNNLTLYNLCGTGCTGLSVLFTIQDTTGVPLPDVQISLSTLIGGIIPFTVGSDLTDTSGQAIFTLNSVADHTLYLNKTGCVSRAISIRPSLLSYIFQIDCGNAGVPYVSAYIGQSEGVLFRSSPSPGAIFGDEFLFSLRVTSLRYNINAIRIELYDTNFTNVATVTKNVDNLTCYPQDCYTNITFNMSAAQLAKMKGRYLVNLSFTNSSGYFTGNTSWYVLEADAYWTRWLPSGNGLSSLSGFWGDFRNVFDSWSFDATPNTCVWNGTWGDHIMTAEDCPDKGAYQISLNRSEFSRIVFIFLILSMLIASFNKFTGYDSANPGSFLGIMTAIFLIGSMGGSIQSCTPGFFYLSQLFGTDSFFTNGVAQAIGPHGETCITWIFFLNNYIVAISVLLLFLTYILNVQRRNS